MEEGMCLFVPCLYHPFHLTSTISTSFLWPTTVSGTEEKTLGQNLPGAAIHAGVLAAEKTTITEKARDESSIAACVYAHLSLSRGSLTERTITKGFDSSYAYEDSAQHSGYYHKNDYQDYGQDERHRPGGGGFNKKRLIPSEPSPHVIFLGLDPDFTEADVRFINCLSHGCLAHHGAQLQAYLTSQGCSIETVTIIRERTSGTCTLPSVYAH